MKELTEIELTETQGGFKLSGSIINGIFGGLKTMFELGRSIGTSLARWRRGKICPLY